MSWPIMWQTDCADFEGDGVILAALPDQIAIINYDGLSIRDPARCASAAVSSKTLSRLLTPCAWPITETPDLRYVAESGKVLNISNIHVYPHWSTLPSLRGPAICYGLATQLGGFITAESQPDQGAVFTVWLKPAEE